MAELTREDVEQIVKEARGKQKRPNLRWANLTRADLRRVDLGGTDLSEADLSGADLRQANLSGANFNGANFSGAYLRRAYLRRVNLSGAHLKKADLSGAYFSEAHLNEANLSKASLNEANLRGVDLFQADFSGVDLNHTIFVSVDFSTSKSLDSVTHFGPSYIDTHTLTRSNGQIPEVFLRGCGLSDWEIENAKLYTPDLTEHQITDITYRIHNLLTGNAIKYNSCFISYSHKDEAFARKLYNDLQDNGIRCWYAPEDMKIGDKIKHTIDQAIRVQDKLLLILSESSVDSAWVEHEVENALELERERKQSILFPIRLDETILAYKIGWATDVKRRHIGDFCQWQDQTRYQAEFKRVLQHLKAEDETGSA